MNKNNKEIPQIKSPRSIEIAPTQILTAQNGVKLYNVSCSDEQVMRMSFVFHAGSSMQEKSFTASATANLLSEGSTNHTSQQIAEQLDYYGSYFDVTLDRDYVVITFCSLNKFFDKTLNIARDILLSPIFPEQEIETYCTKRKQRLLVDRSKAAFQARELFAQSLFGAHHPYGIASPTDDYDKITRDDIVALYHKLYRAENCFAVCSGNITNEITESILSLCNALPQSGAMEFPTFPPTETVKFAFREYKGAVQSAIRIGRRLFPRNHPDFIPMQVLTTVLGGYFGSRLVQNLREERGYTYGVFAAMVNLEHDGYMAIATEVASEATDDAIAQIFNEMEILRTELIPIEELDMVRNIMIGEMMRILDAPFGIADVTIENISNGSDNTHLNRMIAEIITITPEELIKLAQKYLDRESFTVTVVGAEKPAEF